MEKHGVPPSALRYKVWRLCESVSRELTEAAGAHFLEAPAAACDNRGFVRLDYAAADSLHPSPAYGALLIEHMAQSLRRLQNCQEG